MDKGDERHRWADLVATLRRERDELALKIHLGKKEAAAEWEKLEAKWHEIKARSSASRESVDEKSVGLGLALELAAEELKEGYERIRKMLQD